MGPLVVLLLLVSFVIALTCGWLMHLHGVNDFVSMLSMPMAFVVAFLAGLWFVDLFLY